jgi:hypothetical protein
MKISSCRKQDFLYKIPLMKKHRKMELERPAKKWGYSA